MTNPLWMKQWSPYVAGADIGVLSWFAYAAENPPIGITIASEDTAAQLTCPEVILWRNS